MEAPVYSDIHHLRIGPVGQDVLGLVRETSSVGGFTVSESLSSNNSDVLGSFHIFMSPQNVCETSEELNKFATNFTDSIVRRNGLVAQKKSYDRNLYGQDPIYDLVTADHYRSDKEMIWDLPVARFEDYILPKELRKASLRDRDFCSDYLNSFRITFLPRADLVRINELFEANLDRIYFAFYNDKLQLRHQLPDTLLSYLMDLSNIHRSLTGRIYSDWQDKKEFDWIAEEIAKYDIKTKDWRERVKEKEKEERRIKRSLPKIEKHITGAIEKYSKLKIASEDSCSSQPSMYQIYMANQKAIASESQIGAKVDSPDRHFEDIQDSLGVDKKTAMAIYHRYMHQMPKVIDWKTFKLDWLQLGPAFRAEIHLQGYEDYASTEDLLNFWYLLDRQPNKTPEDFNEKVQAVIARGSFAFYEEFVYLLNGEMSQNLIRKAIDQLAQIDPKAAGDHHGPTGKYSYVFISPIHLSILMAKLITSRTSDLWDKFNSAERTRISQTLKTRIQQLRDQVVNEVVKSPIQYGMSIYDSPYEKVNRVATFNN